MWMSKESEHSTVLEWTQLDWWARVGFERTKICVTRLATQIVPILLEANTR